MFEERGVPVSVHSHFGVQGHWPSGQVVKKDKAKIYAISSDTHQLQFIKLHHFKQERF